MAGFGVTTEGHRAGSELGRSVVAALAAHGVVRIRIRLTHSSCRQYQEEHKGGSHMESCSSNGILDRVKRSKLYSSQRGRTTFRQEYGSPLHLPRAVADEDQPAKYRFC